MHGLAFERNHVVRAVVTEASTMWQCTGLVARASPKKDRRPLGGPGASDKFLGIWSFRICHMTYLFGVPFIIVSLYKSLER